jgi:hypothetical protein
MTTFSLQSLGRFPIFRLSGTRSFKIGKMAGSSPMFLTTTTCVIDAEDPITKAGCSTTSTDRSNWQMLSSPQSEASF